MSTATAIGVDFGTCMIVGLADLGPFPAPGADLSLELGLSAWLFRSGADLEGALAAMYEVRTVLLEVAEMDVTTEPLPFVGRNLERDLVSLASYLDHLLTRAACAAGCDRAALAGRVTALLDPGEAVTSLAC
jgi:hypothetical protein